jgi:hypothetical protein
VRDSKGRNGDLPRVHSVSSESIDSYRQDGYRELIRKRRACALCPDLMNPSAVEGGRFDSEDHIGPWSRWQGHLFPQLLVVGQEWADRETYRQCRGLDDARNTTNRNLLALIRSVGIRIDPDRDGAEAPVFLTNAVLCLKGGGMQAAVKQRWVSNCSPFLKSTIEMLKPHVVVSLGQYAYDSIRGMYGLPLLSLRQAVEQPAPFTLPGGSRYFAMYHCGAWGMRARPQKAQFQDWQRVNAALN